MAQYLKIGWMKAVGIVPALFAMGFFMYKFDVVPWLGVITICISIIIGTIYGLLGIVGILRNMEIVEIKKATVSLSDLKIFINKKN